MTFSSNYKQKTIATTLVLSLFAFPFNWFTPNTPTPTPEENQNTEINEEPPSIELTIPLKTDTIPGSAIETTLTINLPTPWVLPDKPLYPIQRLWEDLMLILSQTAQEKMNMLVKISENRLAEALSLFKQQKQELAQKTYAEHLTTLREAELVKKTMETQEEKEIPSIKIDNQKEKSLLFTMLVGEYQMQWRKND